MTTSKAPAMKNTSVMAGSLCLRPDFFTGSSSGRSSVEIRLALDPGDAVLSAKLRNRVRALGLAGPTVILPQETLGQKNPRENPAPLAVDGGGLENPLIPHSTAGQVHDRPHAARRARRNESSRERVHARFEVSEIDGLYSRAAGRAGYCPD